jgi:hypothetical protein
MTTTMMTTMLPLLLLLLLFLILFSAQPISAKIRIPSTFLTNQQHDNSNSNNEKQQKEETDKGDSDNNHRYSSSSIDIDDATATATAPDDPIIYESSDDTVHRKDIHDAVNNDIDDDYETIFNNWMGYPNKNIIDDHKNIIDRDRHERKGGTTTPSSYLLFASSKSNQLFSIAEQRLKKMIIIKNQLERIVHQLFVFTYKKTNDIIKYKFPVGIVTAYVTTKVLSKFIHKCIQKGRKKKKKMTGEDENSDVDADDDDALDTYRYVLRHTGRALDLDSDDVTSYRYNGGIERVRSRLIRSAFSNTITSSSSMLSPTSLMDYTYDDDYDHSDLEQPPYDDNDNDDNDKKGGNTLNSSTTRMKNEYQEHRRRIVLQRKLIETLNKALTIEFVPGGSHSEYVRKMIPSLSKAEEYANQLGIVLDHPAKKMDTTTRSSKRGTGTGIVPVPTDIDTDMLQLMKIGLQTVEIRVLDSHLRSIRDRLIRTTYRLNRTVRYWKRKVESISSSSSSSSSARSSTSTSVSYGPGRKTFLSKLNRRFWRFFDSSTGAGDGSNNSLLEGDRLRLAFAEAAYNAEIIRLGKVLFLLNERPYEMSDSTLTNALVEQQQNREKQEQEQYRQQLLDKQWEEGMDYSSSSSPLEDDYDIDGIDDGDNDDKGPRARARVTFHRMVVTMRDKFRKKNSATEDLITKKNDRMKNTGLLVARLARPLSALVLTPLKPSAFLLRISTKRKNKKLLGRSGEKIIRNKFLTFRFNADGRGKFSVQTYDEGSVTIESDTAQKILLRNYENDQRPWLDSAAKWTLQARGLVVDVISETVQASIHPSSYIGVGGGGNSKGGISSSTHNYYFNEANPNLRSNNNNIDNNDKSKSPATELADLESTWRIRQYSNDRHSGGDSSDNDDRGLVTGTSSSVLESRSKTLLSSILPTSSTTKFNLQQRQWYFVYEMSRDINRLRRVGEGKSLKFKLKEVHWIHWLRQWDLMGLPSAALKIAAAVWIHDKSKPYVPKVKFAVGETYAAAIEILMTRFWTPLKDLADELLSRRKGLVTGVSLREEEASLDIMLHDLGLGDGTPSTRHEAIVKATRQYESDMKTGLMWHALGGRLVRLMLIQMQQLKVSMLDAAETIDVLFQSNRINMQLLAVVPAVGIVFVGAKLFLRSLFHIRSKDLRPIASVHADMTDYLNSLESNVILRMARSPRSSSSLGDKIENSNNYKDNQAITTSVLGEQEKQLGEFALTLYNYLVLLDYSSPQPFSNRQCDGIHRSLTAFLGREGSFTRNNLTVDDQIRLIDLVKDKHRELSKFM